MTNLLSWTNLLAWSIQVALLACVAGLVVPYLRYAKARLYFWQAMVAMMLLLPLLEPVRQPSPTVPDAVAPTGSMIAFEMRTVPVLPLADAMEQWFADNWAGLLMVGAGLRLLWIVMGLFRLRQLRLRAESLAAPVATYERSTRWYVSEDVAGPVTFGWLRPNILLPARIFELAENAQEAIARHELLHVERRDWLYVMAEEAVRSALWFHPAVWFALSRIQLAREQVVDQEVIGITGDREGYLEALVAVAAQNLLPDVAPAPLFLKKRQLAARVAATLKEVPMKEVWMTRQSSVKATGRFAAVACTAVLSAAVVISLFPLQGQAQEQPDDPGITVNAGATLLHRTPVHYPRGVNTTGTVVLQATPSAKGDVTDARVISGPDELRKAALSSVLEWHYSNQPAPPSTVQVSINFGGVTQQVTVSAPAPPPPPPPPPPAQNRSNPGGRGGAAVAPAPPAAPAPPPPPPPPASSPFEATAQTSTIKDIRYVGLPELLRSRAASALRLDVDQSVTRADLASAVQRLRDVDSHLDLLAVRRSQAEASSDITLVVTLLSSDQGLTPRVSGVALPPPDPDAPSPMRMSSGIAAANIIKKVNPVYPAAAKEARVQGAVLLNVIIAKSGAVSNIQVVSGPALLRQSSIDAVSQWEYRPTLLNGQPVEVLTEVTVNYTLQ